MSDTNADDKLIGFEYQFFYFLLSLLRMKEGDTVGFEVEEDVHIENANMLLLCQLKHSIQTNAQNKIKNLTTADNDLWKTLSLWADKIKEISDIDELKKIYFVFVSNKSDNDGNNFLTNFRLLDSNNNQSILDFKSYLHEYKSELEQKYNDKLKTNPQAQKDIKIFYLENILSLEEESFKVFFENITFELGLDNIIEKIKKVLKNEKYMASNFRIDRAFESLIGLLKEEFYKKVKEKESVQYTIEAFANMSNPIFNKTRSDKLIFIEELENFEEDTKILERVFAKQLKDIGIDDDEIYEYDYQRELTLTNLKKLLQDSEISREDIVNLDKTTIQNWKPLHRRQYIKSSNKNDENALDLFYTLLDKDLDLMGQKILFRAISNGQFIKMSDSLEIGWKHNWKEEYKKDDE